MPTQYQPTQEYFALVTEHDDTQGMPYVNWPWPEDAADEAYWCNQLRIALGRPAHYLV
jgi:hypothetical protein